ncbi:MAG: aldo/keto reductase [Lachnospiraceae bacterium]|nr:aldo/keto reductase [Lachnospiraceae bacterium]
MNYIEFGTEKKKASSVVMGCMRIAGMETEQVAELVECALEEGINAFDHADIYGKGESELVFGRVLAQKPALRDQMFLQSKCGIRPGYFDFSKEHILQSVENSLSRLHTDHLDALLLHRPDALMEPEEVAEAFGQLKAQGKVLDFGVSNMNAMQMQLLQQAIKQPLAANQVQLSAAHTCMLDAGFNVNMNAEHGIMRDGGVLEYCRMNHIAVQAWSCLQYGFFEGTFLGSDRYPELNSVLERIGQEQGVDKSAVALAWILRYPAQMQTIAGTTKVVRLRQLAKAADVVLSRQEWYEIYRAAGNVLP